MFESFIASVKNSTEPARDISIDPRKIVNEQAGELWSDLKKIENMSEKETYELVKENYSIILSAIFNCNSKEYQFLLSSPKFITALTQVATEIQLGYDEKIYCNKIIYDCIVYETDQYTRMLMFLLGDAVNKQTVRKLLGCDLDEELAIFLAVAVKSSFKTKINIKRLNFTLASSDPRFMTVQRVINIYEALFNRIGDVFISTMLDIDILSSEEEWVTKEVTEANNNVTFANLLILESLEPIEITKVLVMYAEELAQKEESLKSQSLNPMELKKELAFTLTKMLHDEASAQTAQEEFEKVHQKGQQPTQIPSFKATKDEYNIVDLLVETNLCSSRGEAKRLIEQGGVEADGERVGSIEQKVESKSGIIVRAGKNKFVRLETA
jgi:hypothetical protein